MRLASRPLLTLLIALSIAGACRLKDEAPPTADVPAPPDVAAPPADALRTPSGLASKVLQVGFGQARPSLRSWATVNYTGWTPDGKMFETNQGVEFQLQYVIDGWKEGLQLMTVGEKRRFWIPGPLAYDNSPDPTARRGMLVFDIELVRVR
jgi:peptidylprolyl isomerase